MKTFACIALGVAILLLLAYDVYSTVLHSSSRYGPVGEHLNRNLWRAARFLSKRFRRQRRHSALNLLGPLLLPLLVVVYLIMLIVGFALVYYPYVPDQFIISHEYGGQAWAEAIYFSGITLTTVGYGDVVARGLPMRLVAIAEGASGFALISLTITYLLSVNGALERKRAVSLSLYHQAGEGADVANLVAHHYVDGRFYGLRESLRQATRDIQGLLESHVEHPVIHYFHPSEIYKSLPRILFLLLETCAVVRTALDSEEHTDLRNYPEVRTLEASALHVLTDLVASLDLERRERPRAPDPAELAEDERRRRHRYGEHVRLLESAGIKIRRDAEAGYEEYRERRERWEAKLNRLSIYLGYEWNEVSGDRDLEYAHDEGKEEMGGETRGDRDNEGATKNEE